MKENNKNIRRKTLRKEESLFRQQAGYLRNLGETKAAITDDDKTADELRDLDLLVWDETERYLSCFASDLEDAPDALIDLLPETAKRGRQLGMEIELPPLVAALTCIRILAGGDEVYEKHKFLCFAIMNSQDCNPLYKPLFEKYCQEIEANKYDRRNHKEVNYRRGDPMERLKDTEEEKTNTQIEALLGEILDATKGWKAKIAFGDYWNKWKELWAHLLEQDEQGEFFEKLSKKCPKSSGNSTSINIRLVCNVAGLLKRYMEENLKCKAIPSITNQDFAKLIKESWSSDSCRKAIYEIDELTNMNELSNQIKGWIAMNIK